MLRDALTLLQALATNGRFLLPESSLSPPILGPQPPRTGRKSALPAFQTAPFTSLRPFPSPQTETNPAVDRLHRFPESPTFTP